MVAFEAYARVFTYSTVPKRTYPSLTFSAT